jgi:hypothetical protein
MRLVLINVDEDPTLIFAAGGAPHSVPVGAVPNVSATTDANVDHERDSETAEGNKEARLKRIKIIRSELFEIGKVVEQAKGEDGDEEVRDRSSDADDDCNCNNEREDKV